MSLASPTRTYALDQVVLSSVAREISRKHRLKAERRRCPCVVGTLAGEVLIDIGNVFV